MANGDIAQAAGMDIVPSTAKRGMGYDEINKSRDYVVTFTTLMLRGTVSATAPATAKVNDLWLKPI